MNEHKIFLRKKRLEKFMVLFFQILILVFFLTSWELLSRYELINSFIFSSPIKILKTLGLLFTKYDLITHLLVTLKETLIAFSLSSIIALIIASIMYLFPIVAKIIEPYLTLINSLPKVALGPIIIIWTGANSNSIIFMALLINLIVTTLSIYNGFLNTDKNKLILLKIFKASKLETLFKLVIPSSKRTIIAALKINISMTLIGVIMGEFLVSKAGLGYLIIYGTQVFNLNIVLAGIFVLVIVSFLLYEVISFLEKK